MIVEHPPGSHCALDRRRGKDPDFAIVAADDGTPMPLEGGVGKQLFDGDVLIDEDGGIAVGEIADVARRPALGGDRFDLIDA